MGKDTPEAGEYLRKEAEAVRCFYPEVTFEVLEDGEKAAARGDVLGGGETTRGQWRGGLV